MPKEIGIPAGGSLTADQWLLLANVYGPIVVRHLCIGGLFIRPIPGQVPQLWSACLPDDGEELLRDRLAHVSKLEEQRREARKEAAAKGRKKKGKSGKDSGRDAAGGGEEGAGADEDMAMDVGDDPADNSKGASRKRKRGAPTQPSFKQMLHPEDPAHFLKLSSALRLLLQRELTDADITEADRLLQGYCGDLARVRCARCVHG